MQSHQRSDAPHVDYHNVCKVHELLAVLLWCLLLLLKHARWGLVQRDRLCQSIALPNPAACTANLYCKGLMPSAMLACIDKCGWSLPVLPLSVRKYAYHPLQPAGPCAQVGRGWVPAHPVCPAIHRTGHTHCRPKHMPGLKWIPLGNANPHRLLALC